MILLNYLLPGDVVKSVPTKVTGDLRAATVLQIMTSTWPPAAVEHALLRQYRRTDAKDNA